MEPKSGREKLHERLLESSVFYRTSELEHQQAYLDDIIDQLVEEHLDEAMTRGLDFLDGLQAVTASEDEEEEGWGW